MNRVVVYGTLKQGGALSAHMKGSEFLGTKTLSGYKMYQVSFYPGIKVAEDNSTIDVEVYKVDDEKLNLLDSVEGVPYLFTRETTKDNEFIYLYNGSVENLKQIENGNFDI